MQKQRFLNFFKKHSYLFLIAVICITLAGAAAADILFTAAGSGYGNDRFGLIIGSDSPIKDVVTNLGGTEGTQVSSFKGPDGEPLAAVSQYSGGEDTVWIYDTSDPSNKNTWTKPLKEIRSTVYNIRGMAAVGRYLYMIGYNNGQIAVCDMESDYSTLNTVFYYSPENLGAYRGEAIVAYGGCIYALFTTSLNPWDPSSGYGKSVLVKYDVKSDPTLSNSEKELTLNCTNVDGGGVHGAVCLDANKLYIASIGGFQSYDGTPNEDSMIEVVDLDTMTSNVLIRNTDLYDPVTLESSKFPEISSWTTDFRAIAITPDGDVYIASGGWGNPSNELIFKTDLTSLNNKSIDNLKLVKHFSWSNAFIAFSIGYDPETEILWTNGAEGETDYNGSMFSSEDGGDTWTKYDNTALGGNVSAWNILNTGNTRSVWSINLETSKMTMKTGETGTIAVASITPSSASNRGVRWSSGNKSIATVDPVNGTVTGIAAGTVTITARAADGSGAIAECEVIVRPVSVAGVTITGDSVVKAGNSLQLSASVTPDNATDKSLSWTSGDGAVAMVDSTGKVTGLEAGVVLITAAAKDGSGKSATKEITVKPAVDPKIVISGDEVMLEGETLTLSAVTIPGDIPAKSVTWKSSSPDIAAVSGAGIVTGLKAGATVITAAASDGSGLTATKDVTVQTTTGDTSASTPVKPILPAGTNADPKKANTALTIKDASIKKAFPDTDILESQNGSLYLTDDAVEKAARNSGAKYNNAVALPVFKVRDAAMKAGDLIAVAFEVNGKDFGAAKTADKAQLLKVLPDGTGRLFSYISSPVNAGDRTFMIMDENNNAVTEIDNSKKYRVVAFITDNGDCDLDNTEGVVIDPIAILAAKDENNTIAVNPDTGSAISGGGCNAGFAGFAFAALLPLIWRRGRKSKR